jgi:radical SAM protein with 4Fe4S-binding SPASM domain
MKGLGMFKHQDPSKLTTQYATHIDPNQILINELGPDFAEYRRHWDAADRFEFVPDYPLELGFDIMMACNLKCVGCHFAEDAPENSYLQEKTVFPLDLFEKIVTEGVARGLKSVYFGFMTEPTINKKYLEYVKIAKNAGILDVWFGTHGGVMSKEAVETLVDLEITRFVISVDAATKETYDKVRIGGDFNRLIENIEHLVAYKKRKNVKLPLVRLSFVVNSINQHELPEFLRFWEDKVDSFSIQAFQESFEAARGFTTNPDMIVPLETFSCPQPNQRMFMLSNGDIFPCCVFHHIHTDELKLGNVFNQSIDEIWNGEKIRQLRKTFGPTGSGLAYKMCETCAHASQREAKAIQV